MGLLGNFEAISVSNYDLAQLSHFTFRGFPGGSDGKESACNARDPGLIPGSGRSPGEGNGSPLQYSCLENPTDRGAWQEFAESDVIEAT